MQHEQPKIAAMKKAERIRGRTPDRTDVRILSDICKKSPSRKVNISRMSTMPCPAESSSMNTTTSAELKKMQLENNNLELELLYSQYVASHAELILEKKNLKEAEELFTKTMLSLHEEIKVLLQKYKSLKAKITDIQANTDLQDYLDIIQENMRELIIKLENNGINEKLLQFEKALGRFNVLQCENIVLPSTAEEVSELQKTLKNCSNALQQISDPVQADSIENLAENYEEFVRSYSDFISIKKIAEEKIYNLQADILKACSHLLSQKSDHYNTSCI